MNYTPDQNTNMMFPSSVEPTLGGYGYHPPVARNDHHPPPPPLSHTGEYMSSISPQSSMHMNPYGMTYPSFEMSGYFGQPPSFDSNGTPPNVSQMQPPHHPLPHRYMPPYPPFFSPWPAAPPPTLIIDITPSDVLCGRGGATNSHSGNKKFRALVKEYQERYLKAKKRDKPAVASIIVDLIRDKGGRFLRRYDTDPTGQVRWVDIGDDRAREKTCQALRENAPELRRRQLATSSSSEDGKPPKRGRSYSAHLSPDPSGSQSSSARTPSIPTREITLVHQSTENESLAGKSEDCPIMIRPYTRFLPGQIPVDPIPLDKLSPQDRSFYLQDFLPPCPPLHTKPDSGTEDTGKAPSSPWPVMSV